MLSRTLSLACLLGVASAYPGESKLMPEHPLVDELKDVAVVHGGLVVDDEEVDCIPRDLEQLTPDRFGNLPTERPRMRDEDGNLIPYCDEVDALPRYGLDADLRFRFLSVRAVAAHDGFRFFLELENSDPATVVDLPWGASWQQSGRHIEIDGDVPGDAQTALFQVQTSYGDFSVQMPVTPGIHRCDRWGRSVIFRDPTAQTIELCASGPEGLSMEYLPDDPARVAPEGLAFTPPRGADPMVLDGAVDEDAQTTSGELVVYDNRGVELVRKALRVEVSPFPAATPGVSFARTQVWRAPAQVATKHTDFSFWLPELRGADGSYTWQHNPYLPPGLQLRQVGSRWKIDGIPTSAAYSGQGNVELVFSAPGHELGRLTFPLQVQGVHLADLSFLSQNTLLRPEDPNICLDGPSIGLGTVVGSLFGLHVAGAVGGYLGSQLTYDSIVGNTEEDNRERTQLVADLTLNKRTRRSPDPSTTPFDVVALQELFETDSRERLEAATDSTFTHLFGPPGDGCEINGGLGVMVHDDWIIDWHRPFPFQTEAELPQPDALANKGYTITKILIDPTYPDDYFYVVNSHTDADADDPTVRLAQLGEIAAGIATNTDPDHPVLILGDLNVRGETVEYNQMMAILGQPIDLYRRKYPTWNYASDPTERSGMTSNAQRNAYAAMWFGGELPKRLDYALLLQGAEWKLLVDDIVMVDDPMDTDRYFDQDLDGDHAECHDDPAPYGVDDNGDPLLCSYLSDHYGLRVDARLVWD